MRSVLKPSNVGYVEQCRVMSFCATSLIELIDGKGLQYECFRITTHSLII